MTVPARDATAIRRRVLAWYRATARPLAFRATRDPWAILVSEVMAQQTQAIRAADAWTRFMAEFPTATSLASAAPADVLRAWRGLGYNRRAIALQHAARMIVEEHGGAVPRELEALQRLPGIGPYSARAIAALAFGRRVGAVDTNVRRVLSRSILGVADPGLADRREVQAAADALAPASAPGTWTHALMDIGATVCRSRRPRCEACPVRPWCRSAATFGAAEGAPASVSGARDSVRRRPAATTAFTATSRWLRGRILDRLRDEPHGAWLRFEAAIGGHGRDAVDAALEALAIDGLLELRVGAGERATPDSRGWLEARLPLG